MAETFTRELTEAIIEKIYQALLAAGNDGLTRTQIYRDVCHQHVAAEAISEALFSNLSFDHAYWTNEGERGRPIERWYASDFGPYKPKS